MAITQLLFGSDLIANSDPLASNLLIAIPGNLKYGFTDQAYKIKNSGSPSVITNSNTRIISTSTVSKYYGSSLEVWKTATSTSGGANLLVNTGVGTEIGTGNFCVEGWMYVQNFGFDTSAQMIFQYPQSDSNPSLTQNVTPYIMITGDNWPDQFGTRRGIIHYTPTGASLITQTTTQQFSPSTWHHIAVTRSGTTIRIFVDGTVRATGTSSINYTGYIYSFLNTSISFTTQVNFQDIRVYNTAKYTANFTPPGAMFA